MDIDLSIKISSSKREKRSITESEHNQINVLTHKPGKEDKNRFLLLSSLGRSKYFHQGLNEWGTETQIT